MENIEQIITERFTNNSVSRHLVYEWEDIFSKNLSVPLKKESLIAQKRKLQRIGLLLPFAHPRKLSFVFEINLTLKNRIYNTNKVIPNIIDFYLKEEQLKSLELMYGKNPIVTVSSREVYDFLINKGVELNIAHLPLSISDRYKISDTTRFVKKYDLVLMGRQNPVLEQYLHRYVSTHHDFVYVYRKRVGNQFLYFTSKGESLGNINTRGLYMDLMQKAKAALYATPGIDGEEIRTNGFSQVTPRFFELISSGCHILARYEANPDTEYYELETIAKSITTYQQFEEELDFARLEIVDMAKYATYLKKHYTSERSKKLKEIIKTL